MAGIDPSPHMLEQARNPSRNNELHGIELICGDVYSLGSEQTFNFIYSVGVLGDLTPLDTPLLQKVDMSALADWRCAS
jgi:ubiquinone/menaquinone biosynthesis C-methylase UbiE